MKLPSAHDRVPRPNSPIVIRMIIDKVTTHSLEFLHKGTWLTDNIIDYFMQRIDVPVESHIHAYSIHFMINVLCRDAAIPGYSYQVV